MSQQAFSGRKMCSCPAHTSESSLMWLFPDKTTGEPSRGSLDQFRDRLESLCKNNGPKKKQKNKKTMAH